MSAYLTKQEDTGCTKNCLSRRAKIFVFLIFIFLLQWMPFLARFLWWHNQQAVRGLWILLCVHHNGTQYHCVSITTGRRLMHYSPTTWIDWCSIHRLHEVNSLTTWIDWHSIHRLHEDTSNCKCSSTLSSGHNYNKTATLMQSAENYKVHHTTVLQSH